MGFLFARVGGGFIMEQFGVFINSAISLLMVEIRGETERLTDTLQMCLNPCLATGTLSICTFIVVSNINLMFPA